MTKATTKKTKKSTQKLSEDEIRLSAYYLWEMKGRKLWADQEDWFEAEEYLQD